MQVCGIYYLTGTTFLFLSLNENNKKMANSYVVKAVKACVVYSGICFALNFTPDQ